MNFTECFLWYLCYFGLSPCRNTNTENPNVTSKPSNDLTYIKAITYVDQKNGNPTGALFLLHGSKGGGLQFKQQFEKLLGDNFRFPHIKMIFPTAPYTAYSPLFGLKVRTWYDITGFTRESTENDAQIKNIAKELNILIDREIESGIPINRIAIAGFSRGGAMSIHMGLRFRKHMAGVSAISSFIPKSSELFQTIDITTPFLQQHGLIDPLVKYEVAEDTFAQISRDRVSYTKFELYPTLGHEIRKDVLDELYNFINFVIPNNNTDFESDIDRKM